MVGNGRPRRISGAFLLLAALLGAAGGLHNHADLATAGWAPPAGQRVLSSHNPLEKASHWHSVVRGQEHSCLACHLHRFAAMVCRAPGTAPSDVGLFLSHPAPSGVAAVFSLCDPTRGPPSLS